MTQVRVFIAASVDGFIARKDGGLDWLDRANARVPAGEDCGYAAFMSGIDAIVMGRATYEKVLTFGEWPFGATRVWVLSSREVPVADALAGHVRVERGDPVEILARLSAQGVGVVYLDGGQTLQRFLAAGCVDEMTVTTVPVLLGDGIRLFGALPADLELELVRVQSFAFGYVQSTYRVAH